MQETPQTGYRVKEYRQPVKRYCQTLELRDNPDLIKEYRRRHSREHAWREILNGIRQVGILEMELYILGTPRQAEWEDYMAEFQLVKQGLSSAEKWQLMERMFYLYE